MGLKPPPHNSVKTFLWCEEIVEGNQLDPNNPFRLSKVVLNLPGDPSYDMQQSKVYKWDDVLKQVVNDFATYYDDIRSAGNSKEMCATVMRHLSTLLTLLGQQEVLRTRRPPSQGEEQAWADAIFQIIARMEIYVISSQKKWNTFKKYVQEWLAICINDAHAGVPAAFDRKELKSGNDFFIHIGRTYLMIAPFLKGVHLMLDLWHPGCDEEGWNTKEAADAIEANDWEDIDHSEEAPE
eukprot:10011316-Ditylum_brightwellii.AAC.1